MVVTTGIYTPCIRAILYESLPGKLMPLRPEITIDFENIEALETPRFSQEHEPYRLPMESIERVPANL